MSEFFRALERAEREHALRSKAVPSAPARSRSQDLPAVLPSDVPDSEPREVPRRSAAVVIETMDVPPVEAAVDVDLQTAPGDTTGDKPRAERGWSRPLTSLFARRRTARATGEVDEHLVSLITPDAFEADQYRVLRHTVEQRRRTAGVAVIAVSSAGAGDGTTTTAINLAGVLAQDRTARVLLVDCDLRNSAMARRLNVPEGRGVVQAIVDPLLTLDDVVRHVPRFNLDVMASGFETALPYELLKSPRLGELFDAARRRYDYVVLDTPPIVPFPDCRVLGKVVDGFLVVVQANRTPRRLVDEALTVLPKELVLGIVFNADDRAGAAFIPLIHRARRTASEAAA